MFNLKIIIGEDYVVSKIWNLFKNKYLIIESKNFISINHKIKNVYNMDKIYKKKVSLRL